MKKREDIENRTQDQVEGSPSLAVRNEPTQGRGSTDDGYTYVVDPYAGI